MNNIIIYGASHTGIALAKKINGRKRCYIIDSISCPDPEIERYYKREEEFNVPSGDNIYFVLYDEDNKNIKVLLSIKNREPNAKVYTVLNQENLGEKMKIHLNSFEYVNQSQVAAKKFVDAIYEDREDVHQNISIKQKKKYTIDPLIKKVIYFIGSLVLFSTSFFHFHDDFNWIDSFYFSVTMITTTGFGDYSLRDHSNLSKLIGSLIMLLSVTSFAIVFSLVGDTISQKRKEYTHGVRRYKGSDHVIVIGGGSVGSKVIRELLSRGEKVVLIDKSLDGRFIKDVLDMHIPFIIGDATNEKFLVDANISKCKAIIAVTQNDLINLEVGLDSKTIFPNLRVVLRIYNQDLSASLKNNKIIKHSYSMSYIAADYFLKKIDF